QAEDGIRDRNVTAVQTCALPISDEDSESDLDSGDEIDLEAPTVDDVTEKDQQVTGEGDPGSQVEITDSDGNVIGSGEVADDGNFEIDLEESVSEGDELSITQSQENEDGETFESDPAKVTVQPDEEGSEEDSDDDSGDEIDLDAPTVDEVTEGDQQVTGEGDPGSQVENTDSEDNIIGSGEVDDDGSIAVDLDESVSEGEELSITQSQENEDGETFESDPAKVTVQS